ncbi:MAG: carbamoyl phosphate synthase small subunit, partial [Gemmatimonadota bacterium]|nr:carbamoyl phosphate synthase small subunit [Gemmatimonadota bacterium]
MVKSKKQSKRAVLVIEDGRTFQGTSLGAEGETLGEVVFNTSMTGYQEILGDPSYDSQIVTMTNPHIGNTGINPTDIESAKARVAGFVVSECSSRYSNWRAEKGLDEYLKDCGIVGIEGIDTRALTLHIREKGAMKGIISTTDFNYETLMNKLFKYPGLVGRDLVKNVSVAESYIYQPGSEPEAASDYYTYTPGTPETMENPEAQASEEKHYIAVIDCGIKYNILRIFSYFNCNVIVVPATYSYAEILSLNPDGVFISNGPGDPEGV